MRYRLVSTDQRKRAAATTAAALVLGCAIAYIDTRPTWDDTGVTVGLVVLVAGSLAAVSPPMRWLIGLAVGVPVLVMNVLASGGWSSSIAVAVAIMAAGVGGAIGSAMRH
ncbi:MAG: hypothetical protein ABI542_11105 [Gemmatimonadota bacterium]